MMCGACAVRMLCEVCVCSVVSQFCMRCAGKQPNHQPCWSCIACRIEDASFGEFQGFVDFVLLCVDVMCGVDAV